MVSMGVTSKISNWRTSFFVKTFFLASVAQAIAWWLIKKRRVTGFNINTVNGNE
jgi:hypothetical protein